MNHGDLTEKNTGASAHADVAEGVDAVSRAERRAWRDHLNDQATRTLVLGVIATIVGGAFWGFSGTAASFLFERYQVDVLWLMSSRQLLAGALFMLIALASDRKRLIGLWTTPAHRRELLVFAALGLLLNQFAYLVTVQITNPGTATIMQCLQLLIIMAYSCVRARRRPRNREVAGVVLALGGTFLIATGGDPSRLAIPPLGLAMGMFTAVAASLMTILPGRILPEYGSTVVTGSAMFTSGLVLSAVVRPWTSIPALDADGWIAFAVLILVGSLLAYLLYMQGVKDIGSMRAGLLGTVEPISATLTSAIMLGTVFAPADIVGFAMIIVMVFLTV